MKKTVFLMALLAVLLSACAPRAIRPTVERTTWQTTEPAAEQTSEPPESTAQTEPVQMESTAAGENFWDSPEHAAYQKALIQIHDELYFPELPDAGRIEVWEPGTIEDEQFAIFDVDGDGADELLVSIANTYTAGMCEVIYGYDAGTDGVRVEAHTNVAVTHYPGMLQVRASHNHGYAGDVMWPYHVSVYDEAEDVYRDTFIVDAWDKALADYDNYRQMPYPEEIDTEHDGFVYLITENEELRILNRHNYEAWEAELFAGKEPLTIPWQKMTAKNIGRQEETASPLQIEPATIDGYALTPDGDSVPVQITIGVERVVQGEEAYRELMTQNTGCPAPDDGQEFIIVTVNVTYEGGELEKLHFYKNYPASWAAARIHFNIPNIASNSVDVTSYLANPIWGQAPDWERLLAKGESVSGDIAFLVEEGNTQPLYFVGYNQVVEFQIH